MGILAVDERPPRESREEFCGFLGALGKGHNRTGLGAVELNRRHVWFSVDWVGRLKRPPLGLLSGRSPGGGRNLNAKSNFLRRTKKPNRLIAV